jgi:CRP/FNR family transcriptional regulator
MARIRHNLFCQNAFLQSNATELMDQLLPGSVARWVLPILEGQIMNGRVSGRGLTGKTIRALMEMEPWIRAVTCHHLDTNTQGRVKLPQVELTPWERRLHDLMETIVICKQVPLFQKVPGYDLAFFAEHCTFVKLKQNQTLFSQGEPGDALYILCHGMVRVIFNEKEINTMHPGDCMGEMAIIDGLSRSASCTAGKDCTLLKIRAMDFHRILQTHESTARAVLQSLAGRLRNRTVPEHGYAFKKN